jgi:hypothetical protein
MSSNRTGPGHGTVPATAESRELTDPRAIRAITHPIRLALLDALALEGPLTATRAGELISEPPNACSFHLRQLAKYGFVEEAGSGPGRNRPWRLSHLGMHFGDLHGDPETKLAARGLSRMLQELYFARLQAFYDSRGNYPPEWQAVTEAREFMLHVSPDELRTVAEEITAIIDRYRDRLADPALRPGDSLPIEMLMFSYPVRLPGQ